jgi:phage terminase large subunit
MKLKVSKIYEGLYKAFRYKVMEGGRSSGKSWSAVEYLIVRALGKKDTRILCCREIQGSIRESVHKLISDTIYRLGVEDRFLITQYSITCNNGSHFIFAGLYNNVDQIKSTEGVDICHVEEAHNVSKESWDILIPTIRKEGSEIIVVFNPRNYDDATYQRFVINELDDTSWIQHIDYMDNPHNGEIVYKQAEHLKRVDYDSYRHIWLGQPLKYSEQQILHNKLVVEEFDVTDWTNRLGHNLYTTYHGLDWGYSQDPTAMIRCHIRDNVLYIDKEAGGIGIELDHTGRLIRETFPELEGGRIWADCAQPAMISLVRRQGGITGMKGAPKWSGSVEDGIMVLRSFDKIVVHPDCVEVINEMKNYKWEVDKKTQAILTKPRDMFNHYIDALRYALTQVIEKTRHTSDPWGLS